MSDYLMRINKEDSLKKRYTYKLLTNLIGLAINIVCQMIIPRGLGPKVYGDFQFMTNFFSQIAGFLDMGTSIAFYTKLSQRKQDFGLVSFYLGFTGLVSFLLLIFVGCINETGAYVSLLPGQTPFYIYLAAVWGILTWNSQVLHKMADAYGVTVSTEMVRIIQKGLGLILILTLFLMNQLTLTHFFFYHYFILIFLALSFIWVMERRGHWIGWRWKLTLAQIKAYAKDFYNYSHPLFVYAVAGLFVGILDRWLLQVFCGSVQQGFYGLSYQISTICFLFTSSMTMLMTREFSIAYGNHDLSQMAVLFRRYIPLLYSITAYFACFMAMQADKVTFFLGGAQFHKATSAVAIMSLYPIHQTYGQLSGSVFYATGQTGLYRNIGVIFMLAGLPITFFLIAPVHMMGLDAGALGLAVKMVLMAFIVVNVQLYFNSKLLHLNFGWYLKHQIINVASLLGIAYISASFIDNISFFEKRIIVNFILSGLLYTLLVLCLILITPYIFGITRTDLVNIFRKVKSAIRLSTN